ncbi:RimK family alpha-L-glutamate ligase [Candidatus Woesearchaeota archaeon]|nr:RimK family alpha-L-glutamate ligase [Candidatus Woesearchaeota archaeon]
MKAAVISMGSISSKWIVKAMKKYFGQVDSINIRNLEVNIESKKYQILYGGEPLEDYDCIYCRGSFRYSDLLRSITHALCEKVYMPISGPAFTIGHDKLLTHLKLGDAKIPMPTTYLASSTDAAKKLLKKMSYPIIMKFPQGTHGKGVMFADSYDSASSMMDALAALNQPFLLQEYVETGGVDTRAIVVGNKVVAAMQRRAVQGEKRANIHAGGKGEPVELDAHTKKIAVEAAISVGMDIGAIDILDGPRGPMIIEVNLSPGLQGITKATKIDVAEHIAKFLYKKTKEFKEAGKSGEAESVMKELGVAKAEVEGKQLISSLDFRGNRILLPEIVTNITKFNEKDEYSIKAEKGKLEIEKFSTPEEQKKKK